MPSATTAGRKIGVKIKTAGVISMKIPTNKSTTLIISNITNLFSLIDNIAWDIDWGIS